MKCIVKLVRQRNVPGSMEIEGMAGFEEGVTRDREAKIAVEDVPNTDAMTQLYLLFLFLTLG